MSPTGQYQMPLLNSIGRSIYNTKVATPLVLMNIQDSSAERDVTLLQYNLAHVSIVMDLVVKLIDVREVKLAHILILTLYNAQASVYMKAIESLANNRPGQGIELITVRTVDSFQGLEHVIIILDCVVTKRIGFVRQRQRLNVATSRSRDALYIVANFRAIKSQHNAQNKWLMTIIQHCLKRRFHINIDAPTTGLYNQYVPGLAAIVAPQENDEDVAPPFVEWDTDTPASIEEVPANPENLGEDYQLGTTDYASDGGEDEPVDDDR
ncbi:hypothetical protein MMC30_004457 [Trapelia coarctata]|nr:hypothetical protein [Trapelia coarctata]